MPRSRARAAASPPPTDATLLAGELHAAAIHLLRRLRRTDATAGLSAPRLSALSVAVFAGPLTLGELAAAEQVQPPTMTRLMQALERAGLVAREADPGDGRVVRVRATPKGRATLERARARRVNALAADVARLSASDAAVLRRAVAIIEHFAAPSPS